MLILIAEDFRDSSKAKRLQLTINPCCSGCASDETFRNGSIAVVQLLDEDSAITHLHPSRECIKKRFPRTGNNCCADDARAEVKAAGLEGITN